MSTHDPLGTTFAAGVYASIFGSSREPVNALYARRMFETIRACRQGRSFSVILGGSGAWQIDETDTAGALGIDTIVAGRAESAEVIDLCRRALAGESLPARLNAGRPHDAGELLVPETRTSFGVIEMTTGCGWRCAFCQPDGSRSRKSRSCRRCVLMSPPEPARSRWPPKTCSCGGQTK